MIATFSVGSLSNQWNRAWSCQWRGKGIEFRWLGLLMVTSMMASEGKEADAPFRGGGEVVGAMAALWDVVKLEGV